MAIVQRNPPPSIPLGWKPPDPCPVEFRREGHNVPAQYYCPSCGKRYCVWHILTTAHGCPAPDIAQLPTRMITGGDCDNLYDPAIWQYLTRQVEQGGLTVILRRRAHSQSYAVGIVVVVRLLQFQYHYRDLSDMHLYSSPLVDSLELLVDGMDPRHKGLLYTAVVARAHADESHRQDTPHAPQSVLDTADPRVLEHLGIPDVRTRPGFVPAAPPPPIVDADAVVLSPAEMLAELDARDPHRTRTLPLPMVEESEL